jgi:glucose-1-phosphate thymidylyltransferase
LNLIYLDRGELTAIKFARGTAWLDAGSAETLFESSAYIQAIQSRQGIKIGCIEEECFKRKLINKAQLQNLIDKMPKSAYKEYLIKLIK